MKSLSASRRNVYTMKKDLVQAHDGVGLISFCRPFATGDLSSAAAFLDYVEIPPGASIGLHRHGDDEEFYFLIAGEGVMTMEGEEFTVVPGDLIRNPPHGRHGFRAVGTAIARLLVLDVAQDRASRSPHA